MDLCESVKTQFGFEGETISVFDLLLIVKLDDFSKYRIVVLYPNLKNFNYYSRKGENYVPSPTNDKTVFIFHDMVAKHFVYCNSPKEFFSSAAGNKNRTFCSTCLTNYDARNLKGCECGEGRIYKPARKQKECLECGAKYTNKKKHKCYHHQCGSCNLYHEGEGKWNTSDRCTFWVNPRSKTYSRKFDFEEEDEELIINEWTLEGGIEQNDETRYSLWAWDIESKLILREKDAAFDYEMDDNGVLITDEDQKCISYSVDKCEQVPNFICYEKITEFTDEEGYEAQPESTEDLNAFINFMMTENGGYNICVAHNSSGYDSRLVFDEICKIVDEKKIEVILNGSRIMRMKVGNTIFIDSMLHLKGSLKKLAQGFKLELSKGWFPHLFNRDINQDYIGRIPDKKYFDLAFSVSSQEDLDEFIKFHDEWKGRTDWNFKKLLKEYCASDVSILARIIKKYHTLQLQLLGNYPHLQNSPWFKPTTAGYVHELFMKQIHFNEPDLDAMDSEDLQAYIQTTWAIQLPEEYYFDKLALRGGRTDIRQFKYEGEIHYKDIQSHYPHVQLAYDYPVGTPTIHVFDRDYYPCSTHFIKPDKVCGCTITDKRKKLKSQLKVIEQDRNLEFQKQFINSFFGIAMVDIVPPKNLFHPVLVIFDAKKFKCIATLKPIIKETFTSVELQRAIEMGYEVSKVYRVHVYNKAPSKWRGLLGDMYLAKMRNSGPPPQGENLVRMRGTFENKFDIDLGDVSGWSKNPVLKLVAKQPVTSAWGKHAETVDHPLAFMANDGNNNFEFFQDIESNQHIIKEFIHMSDNKTLYKYKESRDNVRPDLSRGYLPIAVFVPSYARLYLWEEMNKLGKHVLMHDTDSIIYSHNEYDIPEGDCLGDWETEDFEKDNGGINKFIAIGPKSYSLRASNGKEITKCKGVCIKLASQKLINMDQAEKVLIEGKNLYIPQMSFDYKISKGITTRKFEKRICFKPENVKGIWVEEEFRSYPYGYDFESDKTFPRHLIGKYKD